MNNQSSNMNNKPLTMNNRLPLWRFWIPLLFQAILIIAIPAQSAYTYLVGQPVILQTIPIDPYDLLRGYSQSLRYDISDTNTLNTLPGWETLPLSKSPDSYSQKNVTPETELYVILQSPSSSTQTEKPPLPWKAIAVSKNLPTDLPSNQVAIQGKKSSYRWIDYGLETYYFPEDKREEINNYINEISRNSSKQRPFVVEIKVDNHGKAIPISLWIGDKNYRF